MDVELERNQLVETIGGSPKCSLSQSVGKPQCAPSQSLWPQCQQHQNPVCLLKGQVPVHCQEAPLLSVIQQVELAWGSTPLFSRLRECQAWWDKWASPSVAQLIREGIRPPWSSPPRLSLQGRQGENLPQAEKILLDYERSGAVERVSAEGTGHPIPWFLLEKNEPSGEKKWRFISDCRELNSHFQAKKFSLDHMQHIYPQLVKDQWAAKIDLKDAYFFTSAYIPTCNLFCATKWAAKFGNTSRVPLDSTSCHRCSKK